MQKLTTEVLVVGGGTGGTAAAIQAARCGVPTILVSEFPWLGGMLTSAGVSAPDGNELIAFQTGMWGAFLRELQQRQPDGLDHAWVSFFTYEPCIGAQIFADWVQALPNLQWISGQVPLDVLRQGGRIRGVLFSDFSIEATIVLDGTELGDLLALAEVPYRWGWELRSQWQEPSAPEQGTELMQKYPVQSPTWIVVLQDFGEAAVAAEIPVAPLADLTQFQNAWVNYGADKFLNYGRLPGNRFMINWPIHGNDYGEGTDRLIQSASARSEFLQASFWQSQNFAAFIQANLGRRYGLAPSVFPHVGNLGGGAYALHPYYRESRRLQGIITIREQDILPLPEGQVAPLPLNQVGQVNAIAIGNYANDHHYPVESLVTLQPKSIRWGGRWTGTPFTIPYEALIPATVEGLLVCEKNISVSHIANGATRLQPVVINIGQAAGMAAALCIDQACQPRELPVRLLQEALLQDPVAPAAIIPLLNLPPDHPDWLFWQVHYLDHPDRYPRLGDCPVALKPGRRSPNPALQKFSGIFICNGEQNYAIQVESPLSWQGDAIALVTLRPEINQQLQAYSGGQLMSGWGQFNLAGTWILVEEIQ